MNENEIIALLLDVAQGNKPNGDSLSPELRRAITALYDYGFDKGFKEAKSLYKTDTVSYTQADIDRKIRENNDYWSDRIDALQEEHKEAIKSMEKAHEKAIEMLNQVIDIISYTHK